jgi:hypothetical protein
MEVSPLCSAPPDTSARSATVAAVFGVGWDGISVAAPDAGGAVVAASALLKGKNAPIAPIVAEARKWRRPINGNNPGIILLLV